MAFVLEMGGAPCSKSGLKGVGMKVGAAAGAGSW
jgi:hypothetical protein